MFIRDIFKQKKPVLSFEVFPPKEEDGLDAVLGAVKEMSALPIDYMSVTYGAGGSNSKSTAKIAAYLKDNLSVPSLAHLTCVANTKDAVKSTLAEYKKMGIENILALRGDKPRDHIGQLFPGYKYASELVEDIKKYGDFCVGGACYPECHPDSDSLDADIENLKIKVDAGVDFLVTQMFFDNDKFYAFRDRCVKKDINIPINPGIMPLTKAQQIQRMAILSGGSSMPAKFLRIISKYQDNPEALKQAGIAYAVEQIIDLLSNDADGIHIYTMNRPEIAEKIVGVVNNLF
ncbi:MAG: methylenetetrahydrofolate reductase [Clostridia bacterium]|nr:methylenetetrahydrofolate reductase [NAD(P)H] [Clostridia bacterium]MBQ9599277.1 methylenetetrahydrofolate reductase [NAD(P)H] [Clostridia bacterium]